MAPQPSPSWPALGQVQKLTDLFEEKALTERVPQISSRLEELHKLNPELVARFKVASGEEDATPVFQGKPLSMSSRSPVSPVSSRSPASFPSRISTGSPSPAAAPRPKPKPEFVVRFKDEDEAPITPKRPLHEAQPGDAAAIGDGGNHFGGECSQCHRKF